MDGVPRLRVTCPHRAVGRPPHGSVRAGAEAPQGPGLRVLQHLHPVPPRASAPLCSRRRIDRVPWGHPAPVAGGNRWSGVPRAQRSQAAPPPVTDALPDPARRLGAHWAPTFTLSGSTRPRRVRAHRFDWADTPPAGPLMAAPGRLPHWGAGPHPRGRTNAPGGLAAGGAAAPPHPTCRTAGRRSRRLAQAAARGFRRSCRLLHRPAPPGA